MTFSEFKRRVAAAGWTLEQIRCDVPPTAEILAFIEEVGGDYERFVLRLQKAMAR